MVTRIILRDVSQVIGNAQIGRKLARIFSDANFVVSNFYGKEAFLKNDGTRLIAASVALTEKTSDSRLKESLKRFTQKIRAILEQCEDVNIASREIETIVQNLDTRLTTLRETVSERVVTLALEGEDTSSMKQISVLLPGYLETLLRIDTQFNKLGLKYFESPLEEGEHPILTLANDLHLRLRTLSASEPEIVRYGWQLREDVRKYKSAILQFHQVARSLRAKSDETDREKEELLAVMGDTDSHIMETTGNMRESIIKLMRTSGKLMIVFSCAVIISLSILTVFFILSNIRKPMASVLRGIDAISSGDLESGIRMGRSDEWNMIEAALNRMASELKALYSELRDKVRKLENQEKSLRESEEKYRGIFENATEGIFQSSPEGIFLSVNPALARILGYDSSEELIGNITDIKHQLYVIPERREELLSLIQKREVVSGFEVQLYRRDGSKVWISLKARPVRNENGELLFMEGMLEDIDRRKRAEAMEHAYRSRIEKEVEDRTRELSETLRDLRDAQNQIIQSEKMAAMGQLIAGVAHELNTPLGAIQASVSNISDSLNEISEQLPSLFQILFEEEQKCFFALLRRSMQSESELSAREERKLKRTLTRILEKHEVSDADGIADTLTDMAVYDDIDSFLPLFRHSQSELILQSIYNLTGLQRSSQNIAEATELASKVVFALKSYAHYDYAKELVESDLSEGIETVLTLYHNQLKHGIEIIRNYMEIPEVLCFPDELNQVWTNIIHNAMQAMENRGTLGIDVYQEEDKAIVRITDSGKGIPDEIRQRIFEPFFTTKSQGEGSGLGLDITRKIVEKHGGKMEVESEPGRTAFSVILPIKT